MLFVMSCRCQAICLQAFDINERIEMLHVGGCNVVFSQAFVSHWLFQFPTKPFGNMTDGEGGGRGGGDFVSTSSRFSQK